jgi:hypothetical protein
MVNREFTVMSASLSRPTIRHLSQIRINATSRHFPPEAADPDADPCSAGQLWPPRKAPSCGTGRGNGQREVTNSLWWWQPFVLHHHSAGAALFVLINQLSGGGASFRLCCDRRALPSTTRTPKSIARPAAIRNNLTHRSKHDIMR